MKFWHLIALLALALFFSGRPKRVSAAPPGATFTATSVADNPDVAPGNGICADGHGACTLRAAIMEANTLAGADTILLLDDTYLLTRSGANEDNAGTGDLDIAGALAISGTGPATTIIDASGLDDRVFQILPGANVNISGVTIQHGDVSADVNAAGGGILNNGTLEISDCAIEGSRAGSDGGGVFNPAQLSMTDCVVRNNTSQYGGGIFNSGKYENVGLLIVTDSTISNNSASWDGGGIYNHVGNTTIDAGVITTNTASHLGGGIESDLNLTVTNSTVAGNRSAFAGGGIDLNGGSLNLWQSTVRANTSNNQAAGVYVYVASANIGNSTFDHNHAGTEGGGMLSSYSSVTLTNSTVSDNYADTGGGGIEVTGVGSKLDAFNATIAGNIADWDDNDSSTGGGILQTDGGVVNLWNTILAANYHAQSMFAVGDDCDGTIALLYYSLLGTTTNCAVSTNTASITNQSPGLLSLADNGGPTWTRALASNSLAIDHAAPGGCEDSRYQLIKFDQRGDFRTIDGDDNGSARCDMGAYEYGSSAPFVFLPIVVRNYGFQ
jgi:CSLREA domain-containing protein